MSGEPSVSVSASASREFAPLPSLPPRPLPPRPPPTGETSDPSSPNSAIPAEGHHITRATPPSANRTPSIVSGVFPARGSNPRNAPVFARYSRNRPESVIMPRVPSSRRRRSTSSRSQLFGIESALVDERLRKRFPLKPMKVLATIHIFLSVLIFLVQFWTSIRIQSDYLWLRSLNTYGYMCALLSFLTGCCGIALLLQQTKVRVINFLCTSVAAGLVCCYILSFYTTYFAEIRVFSNFRCVERFERRESYQVPFGCMTFLAITEFFISFVSVILVSTVINRARACWWRCEYCRDCQIGDEDVEDFDEEVEVRFHPSNHAPPAEHDDFHGPPSYASRPPPYKP